MRVLGHGGGLSRTLQTCHEDNGWRCGGEIESGALLGLGSRHQRDEFAVDDADECLARREACLDFFAQCFFFDLRDEVLDNMQGDVGIEQRETDLTEHVLGVRLCESCLAFDRLDDPC